MYRAADQVRALAMHPTEYAFASGSADNIKKFRLPMGEFLHNMLQNQRAIINCAAINEDGVLATGADNGSLWCAPLRAPLLNSCVCCELSHQGHEGGYSRDALCFPVYMRDPPFPSSTAAFAISFYSKAMWRVTHAALISRRVAGQSLRSCFACECPLSDKRISFARFKQRPVTSHVFARHSDHCLGLN